ncbi:hypothetical protein BDW74DRAFT_180992 [Aspergillus multicolor]|uniref:uncharacterized protein n=1 Tax=Aspergillus multicolor TaxID=41759 RepID=UPI003CCE2735
MGTIAPMYRVTNIAVREDFSEWGPYFYYTPNDMHYTCAKNSISAALDILRHPITRRIMTQMALTYDNHSTRFNRFGGNEFLAAHAVELFLDKISANSPLVIIDREFTHPKCFAYHNRDDIAFNAAKFKAFVRAAYDPQAYVEWQFQFATIIVHEVGGHMLTTFLGNGGSAQPEAFAMDGYQQGQRIGEAGRFLETQLFGGTVAWYTDFTSLDPEWMQRGIPYFTRPDNYVQRIHPVVFEQLRCGSYDALNSPTFHPFPLRTTGSILLKANLTPLGSGISLPPGRYNDVRYGMIAQRSDGELIDLSEGRRGYDITITIREINTVRNAGKQARKCWSLMAKIAPVFVRLARTAEIRFKKGDKE